MSHVFSGFLAVAPPDDRRARRNVWVLVAAQAVLGAQMPMIFIVGGLAGATLAPSPCWTTLPITLVFLGSMIFAAPLASFMQRHGRRAGFVVGALGGTAGAAIGAWGLLEGSFALFLAGSFLTGIYMSAQGFYRFAAADTASESFRPKAISWVMAGGLLSAVIGPQIVKVTVEAMVVPFLGSYLAVVVLNLLGMSLFAALDIPKPPAPKPGAPAGRTRIQMLREPRIAVAILCATVAQTLMMLMMAATPLAVVACGFSTGEAADVISAHVLAMFGAALVTGHLIARFGAERIVALGLAILAASGGVALMGVELEHFFVALILLGIGWNFGFIGATAMLASAHAPSERGRLQGLNDLIVFGGIAAASLGSGALMNCSGGTVEQGWQLVTIAMLPFLVLAGGALIWLAPRLREA